MIDRSEVGRGRIMTMIGNDDYFMRPALTKPTIFFENNGPEKQVIVVWKDRWPWRLAYKPTI